LGQCRQGRQGNGHGKEARNRPQAHADVIGASRHLLQVATAATVAAKRRDRKLLALMTKRVGVALRTQRENGVVRSDQGPGMFVLWEVVR
jgi:hypothetical protein